MFSSRFWFDFVENNLVYDVIMAKKQKKMLKIRIFTLINSDILLYYAFSLSNKLYAIKKSKIIFDDVIMTSKSVKRNIFFNYTYYNFYTKITSFAGRGRRPTKNIEKILLKQFIKKFCSIHSIN